MVVVVLVSSTIGASVGTGVVVVVTVVVVLVVDVVVYVVVGGRPVVVVVVVVVAGSVVVVAGNVVVVGGSVDVVGGNMDVVVIITVDKSTSSVFGELSPDFSPEATQGSSHMVVSVKSSSQLSHKHSLDLVVKPWVPLSPTLPQSHTPQSDHAPTQITCFSL